MSNSVIKYGDAISLQNNYNDWNGGYLAIATPDNIDNWTKYITLTVDTPYLRSEKGPNQAIGLWQILPLNATPDGAKVKSGDIITLKSLYVCDGGWLAVYNDASLASHPNALYRANTSKLEPAVAQALQWQIIIPGASSGTALTENEPVVLINQFKDKTSSHGPSFLDINLVPKAGDTGERYFTFTSEDESRKKTTGMWRINCVPNPCQPVSPQPDPCHKDEPGDNGKCGGKHGGGCHHSHFHGGTHHHHHCDSGPHTVHSNTGPGDSDDPCRCGKCGGKCGDSPQGGRQCFSLPANTDFGLNVLINSGALQTINVFIDDKKVDTLTGNGVGNVNPGAKTYKSGSGKVCIEVWANGKMSPLRYADNPLDSKPGMAIIGTEDGSDNDYNDAIVILNWGLN